MKATFFTSRVFQPKSLYTNAYLSLVVMETAIGAHAFLADNSIASKSQLAC